MVGRNSDCSWVAFPTVHGSVFRLTVGRYSDHSAASHRWYLEHQSSAWSQSTLLLSMKVNQIRPAHLMAFYANLSEGGVRQDSTYTATAALLKLLPKGQRARIRETAEVGEETMRGLCSGKPVSRKTAEKVADAAASLERMNPA